MGPSPVQPSTRLLKPKICRFPAKGIRVTSFWSPGSKRIALPAGISSRFPKDASRSKARAAIGFEEVIVGTDLDRTVSRVLHLQLDRGPARVEFEIALGGDDAADDRLVVLLSHRFASVCLGHGMQRRVI